MSGNHLFILEMAPQGTTLVQVTSQAKLTLTLTVNPNANLTKP